jgi:hypothetical protein
MRCEGYWLDGPATAAIDDPLPADHASDGARRPATVRRDAVGEQEAAQTMSDLLALDSQGRVFWFDPTKPDVKHWNRPPGCLHEAGDYSSVYLVYGQWYHHASSVLKDLMPGTRPNYATYLTREQARDWFLAVGVPLPDELADLRPAAFPAIPRQEPESLVTLAQAAALVHRSKRALEGYKGRGMPKARVRGGGGKPSLWAYSEIRPWLTKTFDVPLPERFFADRNAGRN